MPIHVKSKGGVFKGYMQGCGELYDSDTQTILKGTFNRGNLIGSDGILIDFTDTGFTYFIGTYDRNIPNGNMIVYEYTGLTPLNQITIPIRVTKYHRIYSEGILISTLDMQYVYVSLKIHCLDESFDDCICDFCLIELQ